MKRQSITWITEKEAAELMGYTPKTLRRFCLGTRKKLPIHTSKVNFKTILYSKTDIDNYIYENSNLAA